MSKPAATPLPGLAFYEVWSGLMKAQGRNISEFAKRNQTTYGLMRMKACGAMNGPDSVAIRAAMMAEVGEELFTRLYFDRMRMAGAA